MLYSVVVSEKCVKRLVSWKMMQYGCKFLQIQLDPDWCHSRLCLAHFWATANQAIHETFVTSMEIRSSQTFTTYLEAIGNYLIAVQMLWRMPF